MSKRRVSFCLTPFVHFYKQVKHIVHVEQKRTPVLEPESSKNCIVDQVADNGFPLPKLDLSNCSSCTAYDSKTPRFYSDYVDYDCYMPQEKIPKYDQSPLSPNTFLEINTLREQEGVLRTGALAMAFCEFQQCATPNSTPLSIRPVSPSPLSMSPLSLSPKNPTSLVAASTIPLPISPENSSGSLNTMS
jgi:hypothetical protein